MEEEFKKNVDEDSNQQLAGEKPVEKNEVILEEKKPEITEEKTVSLQDYEDAINAIKKVNEDKENYRKMANKYKKLNKGNALEDDEEEEDEKDEEESANKIAQMVIDKISPILKPKEEDEYQKVTRRYEELKNSINNKSPEVPNGSSSSLKEISKESPKISPEVRAILVQQAKRTGATMKDLEERYLRIINEG
ncbi:MAG: hypothetical protein EOL95_09215 [Bacteroidia bacterium]|nr:hypothetical protein [Bacteroidia bacterium]